MLPAEVARVAEAKVQASGVADGEEEEEEEDADAVEAAGQQRLPTGELDHICVDKTGCGTR